MKHILYCITRDDGLKYIGITIDYRVKNRISQHRGSPRFKGHQFSFEILMEHADRSVIEFEESAAIKKYNTFLNGLNSTCCGKGHGHSSDNFSTHGYKFSEKSRERMSISAQKRAEREKNTTPNKRSVAMKKAYADDPTLRERISSKLKELPKRFKLKPEEIEVMRIEYETHSDPDIGSNRKNGKIYTKIQSFCNFAHKKYGLTPQGMRKYVIQFDKCSI